MESKTTIVNNFSTTLTELSANRELVQLEECLGAKEGRQEDGPLVKAAVASMMSITVVVVLVIVAETMVVIVAKVVAVVVVTIAVLCSTGSGHGQSKDLKLIGKKL